MNIVLIWTITKWAFLALVVLSIVLNGRKRGWRKYIVGLLIGIDQFFNAVLGGGVDETISSRCARGYGKRWYWTILGRLLNAIDPGHITDSLQSEKDNLHKPDVIK
jgi:hypothetical protein